VRLDGIQRVGDVRVVDSLERLGELGGVGRGGLMIVHGISVSVGVAVSSADAHCPWWFRSP
jgi:hypothetical protein